jgi:hypothetical protein
MRRAVQALVVGGTLILATACGTSKSSDTPDTANQPAVGSSAGAGAQPQALAETKALCESLGQVYNKNMGQFAESLTKMVAADGKKAAQQEAQVALKQFGIAVRDATGKTADAQLKADGAKAAEALEAKSGDATFFKTIKTNEDVNKVLGPSLKEWLSPVSTHCA